MNYRKIILILLLTALFITGFSGCSMPFIGSSDDTASIEANNPQKAKENIISNAENDKIKVVVNDYLTKLYEIPLKDCLNNSLNGTVNDNIKQFIAKDTVDISEGNPEIRIHYPRIVYLNGMLTGSYEIINNTDEKGKEAEDMEISYIGNKSGVFSYFVKMNLKAKCVIANDLAAFISGNIDPALKQQIDKAENDGKNFEANNLTQQAIRDITFKFIENGGTLENSIDNIKIQAKYNFELKKEGNDYKIISAREGNDVSGYLNRISVYNNDFMQRIPYLSIDKNQKGTIFVNQDDIKTYNNEKKLIIDFFNDLRLNLNSDNMNLLVNKMQQGKDKYEEFIKKISVNKDGNSKALADIMDIGPDYYEKFNAEALPIQTNMEKIVGKYSNFIVTAHPGYSEKEKRYFVSFEAPVEKQNGSIDENPVTYKYNYDITLSGKDDSLKISSIILDEYFQK